MDDKTPHLASREWTLIFIFLALLFSLVCIAYLSDMQIDHEIKKYLGVL